MHNIVGHVLLYLRLPHQGQEMVLYVYVGGRWRQCVTCFNLIRPLCIYMHLFVFVDVCVCVCRVYCSHCHQGVGPRWRQDAKEISSRSGRPWYVPRPTHFPLYVHIFMCCIHSAEFVLRVHMYYALFRLAWCM